MDIASANLAMKVFRVKSRPCVLLMNMVRHAEGKVCALVGNASVFPAGPERTARRTRRALKRKPVSHVDAPTIVMRTEFVPLD